MSRLRQLSKKLALLACGLVFGLMAAEICLRAAGVGFPLPYVTDAFTGSRLRPGFEGWQLKEGRVYFHVNRAGFRDRDHAASKPAGTFRVAVLGDSFAEALQVPRQRAFWSVLERELQSCPRMHGKSVEVLNFGISGFGTAQELEMLKHHVWDYAPDLVLLAFFAGNDVRNNSKTLEPEKLRPFYLIRNGKLVLDDSFRQHPDYQRARTAWVKFKVRCINASRVLQVISEFLRSRRRARPAASPDQSRITELGLDDGSYSEPVEPAWVEAWEITDRLILEMAGEVREHGADFRVIVVDAPIQVHPDPAVRNAFIKRLGLSDLDYADRRIEALGLRGDFPVSVLSRPMRERAEQTGSPLHGFENTTLGEGHWNIAGHQLAGELIAKDICGSADR